MRGEGRAALSRRPMGCRRGAMLLPLAVCCKNATALWPSGGAPTAAAATGWGRWEASSSASWAPSPVPAPGAGAWWWWWGWVAACGAPWLLVAWTLLGNGLVCAAVVGCRRLRARATHLLLASLAVSDLLVALLVMPWKAAAQVAGRWPFGDAFCRLWVAFDILCSTASILHLCLIALDRYWAVARPFRYARRMSPRLALALAGLAWALALLLSFLPVHLDWHRGGGPDGGGGPPDGGSANGSAPAQQDERCDASLNRAYAVSSSLISFYIPVGVMLVAYGRIYRIAQGQIRRIASLERAAERAHQNSRASPRRPGPPGAAPAPSTAAAPLVLRASLGPEARVLKTLALVLGVFVGCWLPFFVLNCLLPFCGARPPCVSPATFDLFVWVGWANSSLNPLIYACNADFRRVFSRLLGCGHRCAAAAAAPLQTANISRELLSCPLDPLPPPRRLPSDDDAASRPCLGTPPGSPEPTDGQPDLSLDPLPACAPR